MDIALPAKLAMGLDGQPSALKFVRSSVCSYADLLTEPCSQLKPDKNCSGLAWMS
jgi:hypothetical protein